MSYIGNEPIVSATRTVTEVTATAGQTVFNANGGYTVGYLDVFLNGSKLTTTDFTATNGSSITLTESAQVGDIVRLEAWGTFSTSTAVLRAGDTMTGALLLPDGSASAPALSNDGDTNTGIFFPAADTIAFSEGGTESMRIDSSGNVGIGVTPSASTLKALQVNGASLFGYSNLNTTLGANIYYDGSNNKYISNGAASLFQLEIGGAKWFTAPSGTAGNTITFTQAMTLDSSGNLLVGHTTATNFLLDARKSNGGNAILNVHNTSNTSGDVAAYLSLGANANNTSSYYLICNTPAVANRMFILGNGNIVNSNNSYGALSDIKLKENIVDATSKLEKLNQVRIVNYNLKGETTKQIGVVAQELEQIFPSMIDESPDLDAEGNELGTTTKSVKYSVFVPMLIKAIQEQQVLIQSQADTITAMEARLTALEVSSANASGTSVTQENK